MRTPRSRSRARKAPGKPPHVRAAADLGRRASGVLLHPTSLPGPYGVGDLGPEAHRFADFLASAGQAWWQTLPVGPTGFGNSPYSALSTFAGNPLLISPDLLVEEGLLEPAALAASPRFPEGRVDFGAAPPWKNGVLRAAFERFRAARRPQKHAAFEQFCEEQRAWLDDFALFAAIKAAHGGASWTDWEPGLRARKKEALAEAQKGLADAIELARFEQWLFAVQWGGLRAHAAARGVHLIGDVPIFVAHDSADVWAHPELFKLDRSGRPKVIAGVPPDYFSKTGQRWGNPVYDWPRHKADGYRWWIDRIGITLARFDAVRLDHFIGFYRYWEIPASAETAERGRWRPGPRDDLFNALRRAHGGLPLIAEDLGLVTPEVTALRERFGLPGIKILQFAFGGDPQSEFLPHNWPRACVAYTGSHDNDTTVGWYNDRGGPGTTRSPEQADRERQIALEYLGSDGHEVHWDFIRALLASVATLTIVPAQDLLGLSTEARMNLPGSPASNWEWRLHAGQTTPLIAERFGRMTWLYGRGRARGEHAAG